MKYFALALAIIAPSLVSCAPQQPIVHRYYHYRVVEDADSGGSSRPAPRRTTRSSSSSQPAYTLPGTPTRWDDGSR